MPPNLSAGDPLLQFGVPGGPELLIVLLILLLTLAPIALVAIVAVAVWRRRGSGGDGSSGTDADRVEELERRVDELEAELEAGRDGSSGESAVADRDEARR